MQDAADIADKKDDPRWFPVWAVVAILKRPERTIRDWARKGLIPTQRDPKTGILLLDGAAATRLHEQTETRHKSSVSVIDTTTSSTSSSVLQSSAQKRPGPPSRTGLSCVQGREVAITDQTPEPPQSQLAPTEIVVPVSLDLSKAERQLGEFCDRVVRDIGQAVATGLAVHSMTVVMAPPPLPHTDL